MYISETGSNTVYFLDATELTIENWDFNKGTMRFQTQVTAHEFIEIQQGWMHKLAHGNAVIRHSDEVAA
jgi:hypothetical protein